MLNVSAPPPFSVWQTRQLSRLGKVHVCVRVVPLVSVIVNSCVVPSPATSVALVCAMFYW